MSELYINCEVKKKSISNSQKIIENNHEHENNLFCWLYAKNLNTYAAVILFQAAQHYYVIKVMFKWG